MTNPQTRHPGIVAVNAASLEELAPGRTILGIGVGDRPLRSLGLRPARLQELRDSISVIRRLLAGEQVSHDGTGFTMQDAHLRFGSSFRIPVFVSASGPQDSGRWPARSPTGSSFWVGSSGTASHTDWKHIQRWSGPGRPAAPPCSRVRLRRHRRRGPPAQRWRRPAPSPPGFPQTAPFYCELAGLDPAIANEVKARYAGGEFQEAQAAASIMPDWFVRKMAFAGDSAQAMDHLRTLEDLGVDSVTVFPLGLKRRETVEAFARVFRRVINRPVATRQGQQQAAGRMLAWPFGNSRSGSIMLRSLTTTTASPP